MKKMILIMIIILSIFITGCTNKKTDAYKFKEEYEKENGKTSKNNKTIRSVSIPEDNPIIYKNAEDISKMIDNGDTFIVYFGFSTCPWCRSIVEELIKCAKDNKIDKIYYVDILNIRDEKELDENGNIKTTKNGTKGYNELLDKLKLVLSDYTLKNDNGEEISTDEKRIYAPNIVAVVNGEAEKMDDGISDELKDPYQELTSKMKKETYNKFNCLFKCLEDNDKVCKTKAC